MNAPYLRLTFVAILSLLYQTFACAFEGDPLNGLNPDQIKLIKGMANGEEDLELFRNVWLIAGGYRVKPEVIKEAQKAILNTPDWQGRIWNRIAALAEPAEISEEEVTRLNETERKAFEAARQNPNSNELSQEADRVHMAVSNRFMEVEKARKPLVDLVSRLAYLDSEEVAYLMFPLLESNPVLYKRTGVVSSGIALTARSNFYLMQMRGVKFREPVPTGYHERTAWIERNKAVYGTRYRLPYLPAASIKTSEAPKGNQPAPPEPVKEPVPPRIDPEPPPLVQAAQAPTSLPSEKTNSRWGIWLITGLAVLLVMAVTLSRSKPKRA